MKKVGLAAISYAEATCRPDDDRPALVDRLNLDVAAGELVALVGPPGGGKEVALRMAAGLEPVTSGAILISGQNVTKRDPFDRKLALVQGDQMIYPHMTISQNIAFSLKVRGRSRMERRARVIETAELLGLDYEKLYEKPGSLSASDRHLVALGRAVARGADVLLLHEPAAGLPPDLRAAALTRIGALQRKLGTATILVSDDVDAALALGDRVAVMEEGRLVALDTARNLYEKPANAFVAGAIGSPAINLRTVRVSASGAMLDETTTLPIPAYALGAAQLENLESLIVGYRPHSARPASASAPGALGLNVELVEPLGPQARIHGRLDSDGPQERSWVLTCESRLAPRTGERVHFTVDERAVHLFDPETGLRLN